MKKASLNFALLLISLSCICGMCSKEDNTPNDPTVTVTIGTQVWMTRNLDVSTYRNGDPIPQVTDRNRWENLTKGAWCYYMNNQATEIVFGKLYNWYAVNDPRGLAPQGMHIPSDGEWTTLINFLGGELIAGGKMKATDLWNPPNTGATNSSGFSGLPGGFRDGFGEDFKGIGNSGDWWSSTSFNTDNAWAIGVFYKNSDVDRDDDPKTIGLSVRCIKD